MSEDNMTVAEAEAKLATMTIPDDVKRELLNDVKMANAMQDYINGLAEKVKNGESASWEELSAGMNKIAEEHGVETGIPMPHVVEGGPTEHPLVLAKGAPLAWLRAVNESTEAAQRMAMRDVAVRNSWEKLGDYTVIVVNTDEGPMSVMETHSGGRLRKLIDQIGLRHDIASMTAEAELKAVELLKTKVTDNQYTQYVLNGAFIERSKRSDIVYLFRKGLPTLALSWHGKDNEGGKCIAALCTHPMGYYGFSHVGVMCPTDEVIAALLMMRGDEHRFWKNSGQWCASDPRSGI